MDVDINLFAEWVVRAIGGMPGEKTQTSTLSRQMIAGGCYGDGDEVNEETFRIIVRYGEYLKYGLAKPPAIPKPTGATKRKLFQAVCAFRDLSEEQEKVGLGLGAPRPNEITGISPWSP